MHSTIRTIAMLFKCSEEGTTFCSFNKVKLVWIAREVEMIEIFYDTWLKIIDIIDSVRNKQIIFELELRCTSTKDSQRETPFTLPIAYGRANLENEVKAMDKNGLVYVCGTPGMVEEASALSYQYGIHFKSEVFIL